MLSFIKESYLVAAKSILSSVRGVTDLDPDTAKKANFYTRQFVDAISPSNFVAANPECPTNIQVIAALANLNVKTAYLDGELRGVDDAGLPSFPNTQWPRNG